MKKYSRIVIFLISIICLGYSIQNRWLTNSGQGWRSIIGSDGYGYYGYLPCIFIYHSLDYDRALHEEQKIKPDAFGFGAALPGNKSIDKWFPGVAIVLTPFFLIAYLLSHIMGYSTGGYEFLFQASVSIGAIFYLTIGLIFLRKLLKEYGVSEGIISLMLLSVVFGTNLLYYATIEPSMSHVYSFGLTSIFLFYTEKSIDEFKLKNRIFMVISISILMLIRPTNLISLLFIPVLAGSYKNTVLYIGSFFKTWQSLILLLISFCILGIQLELWYLQSGHFFVWSYQKEGFNFTHPHFFDILFNYRNGWFIYSPLMFIACFGGLFALYRQNTFRFSSALLFFLVLTYVLSSWWAWWYGGAFGLRSFIDFYPIFILLLALFFNSLTSQWVKIPLILVAFLCMGLNFFQTYQYNNSILPTDGVTKEKYWKIFLRDAPSFRGLFDYPDTAGFTFMNKPGLTNDFESNTTDQYITTRFAHSGTHSIMVNEKNPYSPSLTLKDSVIPEANPLYVFIKVWVYMPDYDNNAAIVISVQNEKRDSYFWGSQTLQGFVLERNKWCLAYALVKLPAFKKPSDELVAYVFNGGHEVYIDDLEMLFGTRQL